MCVRLHISKRYSRLKMNKLISDIEKYCIIKDDLKDLIAQSFTFEKISKDSILLSSGNTAKKKWFISSGIAKAFFLDKNGDDKIIGFHLLNTFMTQTESYHLQSKSSVYIKSVTEMEVLCISNETEITLLNHPQYLKYLYLKNLNEQIESQKIYKQILYQNGEERYQFLLDQYPSIIKSVKLKDIASFIGISQERLSRIRNNIIS
jgi:CRP/FNR family transcriptional regulator, anaerobic regulatory protein